MKWLILASGLALATAACHRHEDHTHAPRPQGGAAADSPKAVDPICGMDVEKAAAKFKSAHEGKEFFFCNAGCKERFDKQPGRYKMGYCGCADGMPDCNCGHCKALTGNTAPKEACPCHDENKKEGAGGGGHKHDH